jgi:hypothetical protein
LCETLSGKVHVLVRRSLERDVIESDAIGVNRQIVRYARRLAQAERRPRTVQVVNRLAAFADVVTGEAPPSERLQESSVEANRRGDVRYDQVNVVKAG